MPSNVHFNHVNYGFSSFFSSFFLLFLTIFCLYLYIPNTQEQKLKRNVSFKMPELSEAQEVNGVKEIDTTDSTTQSVTPDSTIIPTQQREEGRTQTLSGSLRRQDDVDTAQPKLLSNSVLKALGLVASKETKA